MERHSAFPDFKGVEGINQILRQTIKQDIAQPPTQDNPHGNIEQEIVNIRGLPSRTRDPGAYPSQPPAGCETEQVHESVPVNRKRADTKRHRINARILDHGPLFYPNL